MVHGAAQAAADRRQRASSFIGDQGTTFHTAVRRWRRSSFYRRNRRACQAAAPAPRTRATLPFSRFGVSAWWGGPPGPRRTPRPPHIAPQNAGHLSQADTPLPDLVKRPRHAAALYNERDYATPSSNFPSR